MRRSHGVMVSTLDSESSDPSSSLGGTCDVFFVHLFMFCLSVGLNGVYSYTDLSSFLIFCLPGNI